MTAVATSQPAPAPVPGRYTHRQVLEVLTGLLLAMLTSMIATSVISTALPTIVGELGGQDQLSWIASATLLTMTASTPLWGKLSDVFGRKLLFQLALGIFVLACAAAGLSQNMGELIGARALQGVGAGGLSALVQVILGDLVEPRERGRYSGYIGATFGFATVVGPLLGGFIVDASWLGWRWCFYVSIPLAVVAFFVIQKVLKLPPLSHRETRIDWLGAFFLTAAASSLMLLLSLGGTEFAWGSAWTFVLAGGTAVCAGCAIAVERRATNPILPPRLFTNKTVLLCFLASLFVGMALFGVIIYMPQYLQIVDGMSPTASGLMTLPMVGALFLASITSGRLISRFGRWKGYPVAGLVSLTVGLFLLSRLDVGTSRWIFGLDIAAVGLGMGLSMQVLILAAQNAAGRADIATTTSSVSFFRSLGGAIGVAAFGAVLSNRLGAEMTSLFRARHIQVPAGRSGDTLGSPDVIHHLPGPIQAVVLESFTRALDTVFLLGVPVALVGLVTVLLLPNLALRSARNAEPARPAPTEGTDALAAGLVLALVAARADRLREDSSVTAALAELCPERDGSTLERARYAARTVVAPLAADLLRRAAVLPVPGSATRPVEPATRRATEGNGTVTEAVTRGKTWSRRGRGRPGIELTTPADTVGSTNR